MDNKKLAKLIDGIVKLRLEKILKSDQFKSIIEEQVNKKVIKILLEANGGINISAKKQQVKKSTTAAEILGEDTRKVQRTYPKLPNKSNRTFSKNPTLNTILKQTAGDTYAMASYNSQTSLADMVDSGQSIKNVINNPMLSNRVSVDPGNLANEALAMAQGELSKYSTAKSITTEINMDESNSTLTSFKDMFDDKYIEYNEDISNIDSSTLLEGVDNGLDHVANALTRDYSTLLAKADKMAKDKRPVL